MAYSKITAIYQITTPTYLGSHSPDTPAQRMREASFKGALRFWWRALVWHKAYRETKGNENEAVKTLRRWEAELFGTASDTGAGNSQASPFRLRCDVDDAAKGNKDTLQGNGWNYLKGQGLQNREAAFAPGSRITAHLLLARPLPASKMDELLKALVALGLFGGIGARTRRGVGSVAIQTLQVNGHSHDEIVIPQTPEELGQALEWLEITKADCPQPPLAAFSRESRIDWWEGNLTDFGFEFLDWRSYYDHRLHPPAPKTHPNFPDDHHEMLRAAQGGTPSKAPKRAVFGLPHNYYFRSIREKVDVNYTQHDRHASPFFIHCHAFEGQKNVGVIQTFLPNRFVEDHLHIKGRRKTVLPFQPDRKEVCKFMNHMGGKRVL